MARGRCTARRGFPPNPEEGYIQVNMLERDLNSLDQSMWWVVISPRLHGHIDAARLVRVTGSGQGVVLLELPARSGVGNDALSGNFRPYQEDFPFQELFDMLRRNEVALEIETDLPGREVMRRALVLREYSDWDRPHCS